MFKFFDKVKFYIKEWSRARKYKNALKLTINYFSKRNCDFFSAAFIQRECPNCGFINDDKEFSLSHYTTIIMDGWNCQCGWEIKNYWERFKLDQK